MFYLYSYANITTYCSMDATTDLAVFVGTTSKRSSYRSVKDFYTSPIPTLAHSFSTTATFTGSHHSVICPLADLETSTIRAAIAKHFPEYLI